MNVILAAGITGAQIAALLAPVPYCSPAVELLIGVIQLCDQVPCNKSVLHCAVLNATVLIRVL